MAHMWKIWNYIWESVSGATSLTSVLILWRKITHIQELMYKQNSTAECFASSKYLEQIWFFHILQRGVKWYFPCSHKNMIKGFYWFDVYFLLCRTIIQFLLIWMKYIVINLKSMNSPHYDRLLIMDMLAEVKYLINYLK